MVHDIDHQLGDLLSADNPLAVGGDGDQMGVAVIRQVAETLEEV